MVPVRSWRATNLANWESRVPVHTAPDGYDLAAFDDPTHLTDVVRYDLPRLGRLDGLDVVHLQCHIGTDTVSLARLGARSVTGVDFSPAALSAARSLSTRAGEDVAFTESDVYDSVDVLGRPASISCTPASARSAGCPTSRGGPRWWPGC